MSSLRLDGGDLLGVPLGAVRAAVGLDSLVAYGMEAGAGGFHRSFGVVDQLDLARFFSGFDEVVRASPRRFVLFNPLAVEAPQRNRALALPPVRAFSRALSRPERFRPLGVTRDEDAQAARESYRKVGPFLKAQGLANFWQLRTLVCDGPRLLGWVGGFREEPPTARERALLQRLVPALQRRLRAVMFLKSPPETAHALAVALDAVERPAFITNEHGRVEYANAPGRAQLEEQPGLGARLVEALKHPDALGFSLTPLRAAGMAAHYLLLSHPRTPLDERLERASRDWRLSPRQVEVLSLVAQGLNNRAIGERLGCTEHTVELHVSGVLKKSGAKGRTALVARLWGGH